MKFSKWYKQSHMIGIRAWYFEEFRIHKGCAIFPYILAAIECSVRIPFVYKKNFLKTEISDFIKKIQKSISAY